MLSVFLQYYSWSILLFDRPDSGERAILVHLTIRSGQEDLLELKELAKSAGTDPVYVVTGTRKRPDPKYFVGSWLLWLRLYLLSMMRPNCVFFCSQKTKTTKLQ